MSARTAVVLLSAATLAGLGCAPAAAGGVGAVGHAAFGNTCGGFLSGPRAVAERTTGGWLLGGNVLQTPAEARKNSCGSTDVDIDLTT